MPSLSVSERGKKQVLMAQVIVLFLFVSLFAGSLFAQEPQFDTPAYRQFPIVGSRVALWVVGQLHLMFAAADRQGDDETPAPSAVRQDCPAS